ncbi:MAG: hypothetical protein KF878_20390 [Planctomycetes bacterium]|nr:hypothetical protein [Planctomycetota bacterium]
MSDVVRRAMSSSGQARQTMREGARRAEWLSRGAAFTHGPFSLVEPPAVSQGGAAFSPDAAQAFTAAVLAEAGRLLDKDLRKVAALQAQVLVEAIHVDAAGDPVQTAARKVADAVRAACKEQVIQLSAFDRLTLGKYADGVSKQVMAQAYFEAMRDLADEVLGDASKAEFSNIDVTNIHRTASLWWQQARHGKLGATLGSVPATTMAALLGALQGTPIENAVVSSRTGQLERVSATGHGANVAGNSLIAMTMAGIAYGMMAGALPATGGLGIALLPLISAAPLLRQRFGQANAPVHELTHALQFLTLGHALRKGVIAPRDFYAIQNDAGKSGYLWGGRTEAATVKVELGHDLMPMFDALRTLGEAHLAKTYGDPDRVQQYTRAVDEVKQRVRQRFAGRGLL